MISFLYMFKENELLAAGPVRSVVLLALFVYERNT